VLWSYVGLWAAFVLEIGVRLPSVTHNAAAFIGVIVGGSAVLSCVGGYLIENWQRRLLFRVGVAARDRGVRGVDRLLPEPSPSE